MADQVRQPVQKRSIETKNKIIRGAYDVFSEVGYFSTNTAEIAKYAGVSTGIVYGYFKNKRDIMLDVVDLYIEKVYDPIIEMFDTIDSSASSLENVVDTMLNAVVKAHLDNAKIHEALNSLTHTDPLVAKRFHELVKIVNKKVVDKFIAHGYKGDNLYEKVHVVMNIMQSFAHEVTYDRHDYINMDAMHDIVKDIMVNLFK